jgi:predicted protein tyrosine phosphatase
MSGSRFDAMDIRICSYLTASVLLENEPGRWDALVILDSHVAVSDFVQSHSRRHLFLRFDDVERSAENRQIVRSDHIAEAVAFAKSSERLLVSCRAGQSRSSAVGYLIACREQGADAALSLLDPTRHAPNPLVVSVGAAMLDMPDALEAFDRWRKASRHFALSD